jgi:hypothetical protein
MKIKIIDILLTLSILTSLILVIWFIFGNSPTIDQIMVSFITGLFFFLLKQTYDLNNKIHQTREYMLKEFNKVNIKLEKIDHKLSSIEQKL